jgi:trehalose 6-phosphate synthase
LLVISNRVARQKQDEPMAGGLAAALLPVVKSSGAIWVGSNVRPVERMSAKNLAEVEAFGQGALAQIDIAADDYRGFYEGFANSALWPMLHSRADLIRTTEADYRAYANVNASMARATLRFRKPDTTFWVHDYHFLLLGQELRKLGVDARIGFFLHTPFPGRSLVARLPHHRELVRAMLAYDLIGFQTEEDKDNFADYLAGELGISAVGDVRGERGETRLAAFPIGIDAKIFADRAVKAFGHPQVTRLRAGLQGVRLAIGVDRIDYSKGLVNRFRAVDRLLQSQPALRGTMTLLQIAVPSRERIDTYRTLKSELAALVGEINGRHGELDWEPIRYLNRAFGQQALAGLYRAAQVGLVTPLRDGMNLVAKEYVAAQNPFDPGILVLSKFAGAAKQLESAIIVDPHDIDGLAAAVARALAMSREERRERWRAMTNVLESSSLSSWFSDFVGALTQAPTEHYATRPPEIAASLVPEGRPELPAVGTL